MTRPTRLLATLAFGVTFFVRLLPGQEHRVSDDERKRREIETLFAQSRKLFPDVAVLDVEGVLSLQRREKIVLVDIREDREMDVSILPGAISKREFERDQEKYRRYAIVAYCTIGHRSGFYAGRLREAGFRAYDLKGGVLAWAHAKQSLVNKQGPTRRVHVYGPKWNLLPKGYEAIW